MNCVLGTKRTLTTESLTVFIRQEMWHYQPPAGRANTGYMFIYLLPACEHCLNGRGRTCKKEILFLLAGHTHMLDLHLLSQGASATSSVLNVTRKFKRQDHHHHHHSFNSHLLNTDYRTVTVLGSRVTTMSQPSMSFPFPIDFPARLLLGSTYHHHHTAITLFS